MLHTEQVRPIIRCGSCTRPERPACQGDRPRHAGVLLEMLKGVHLHRDIGPEDRFFWYTTTGWIMWNVQVSGLLAGATAVLYDGHPGTPDLGTLWRFVERVRATFFGAGPHSSPVASRRASSRQKLRTCLAAYAWINGSPLPAEAYRWAYDEVKRDLWLVSIAGGTDLAGAFLTGLPTLRSTRARCSAARWGSRSRRGTTRAGR